jgi:hypothetical protein
LEIYIYCDQCAACGSQKKKSEEQIRAERRNLIEVEVL